MKRIARRGGWAVTAALLMALGLVMTQSVQALATAPPVPPGPRARHRSGREPRDCVPVLCLGRVAIQRRLSPHRNSPGRRI